MSKKIKRFLETNGITDISYYNFQDTEQVAKIGGKLTAFQAFTKKKEIAYKNKLMAQFKKLKKDKNFVEIF